MQTRHIIALAAFSVTVLLSAIYWPGLHGGFFFDDAPNILQADSLRLAKLSAESLQQVFISSHQGLSGRLVAQFSFALNYYFSGFDPFAFKATNLVIHASCATLISCLTQRLLTSAKQKTATHSVLIVAGILATAWLLHPIQLTSVLYVVQRMTSLSAMFLLAALLLHISARESHPRAATVKLIVGWGLLWPLSFFSKETGALFPLFALAWELIIRRNTEGGLDRFARIFAAAVGLSLLAATAYALSSQAQWLWAGYSLRAFSLTERLLTEARVLWFYLGLISFPQLETLGLYHDDILLSTNLFTPWTTLPSIAGLIGLVWLAWWSRARAPLVSFGIVWFFIGHGMESTVLPLEIAHEHRNYLPLFGILLVGAWALRQVLQSRSTYRTIGIALAAGMLAYLTFITALRSHQFGDDGRRSQIEAQHHRTSASAQIEAGRVMAEQPDAALPNSPTHSLASAHYKLACGLDPNSKVCWLGLMYLNCKAGVRVEQSWITELARRLQETPFAHGDQTVLYGIKELSIDGSICLDRESVDRLFAAALANPHVPLGVQAIMHSWHADYLWLHEHDISSALGSLKQSLAINPSNPSNRLKWAQLIFISGDREQARLLFLKLSNENLSADEKKTLNELLATYNISAH